MIHVVCAVIQADERILCLQKGLNKYSYISQHWEFPGGKVEQGESESEALRRELIEELDYPVEVQRHLLTTEHTYPDFEIRLSAWLCRPVEHNPLHPELLYPNSFVLREHLQYRWLSATELHTLSWAAADAALINMLASPDTTR